MDKKHKIADIKGVISREKRYSTLAKKEGQYAKKVEKQEHSRHKPEMAKDSKREASVAFSFAKKRKGLVKRSEAKLKKLVKHGVR